VRLARRERKPNRQAPAIDHRMYLAGQTASRSADERDGAPTYVRVAPCSGPSRRGLQTPTWWRA